MGSSCEWDEESRTCLIPEPEEDMETSLVISTISLILTLPFEAVIVTVFAAFIVRPTKGAKKAEERWVERRRIPAMYVDPRLFHVRQQILTRGARCSG